MHGQAEWGRKYISMSSRSPHLILFFCSVDLSDISFDFSVSPWQAKTRSYFLLWWHCSLCCLALRLPRLESSQRLGFPQLPRWVKTPVVHKRARPTACDADNVVKALRRFSASAVPFCSSFLHIPKSTVTTIVVSRLSRVMAA